MELKITSGACSTHIPGYEPVTSFRVTGTCTCTVPRLFGDIGGLPWGVVGAVRVPVSKEERSTLEFVREGGAEPVKKKVTFIFADLSVYRIHRCLRF